MGWNIGIPSLKLNNVGKRSKHCGSFAGVAMEALEERKGRDPDIDPELAHLNIYEGITSAKELMEYSQKHVQELSDQQREAGGRKIRDDAVVMCSTIIKPPAEMMAAMSRDDQIRFLRDAAEKLSEIVGEGNVKSKAFHFDEQGGHLHILWEPITEDGRLCAKELHNIKFFGRVNREMPEYLRSRGWDIDDCNAYDAAKDELEKDEQRKERRKKSGRSSAVYKHEMEQKIKEMERQAEELGQRVKCAEVQADAADLRAADAEARASAADRRVEKAEQNVTAADLRAADAEKMAEIAMKNHERISQENSELQEQLHQGQMALEEKEEQMNAVVARNESLVQQNDQLIQENQKLQRSIEDKKLQYNMLEDYAAYVQENVLANESLDKGEEIIKALADEAKPFRRSAAETLIKVILEKLEDLRNTIEACLQRMRFYEIENKVEEKLSEPVQARKTSLDAVIASASQKAQEGAEKPKKRQSEMER